MTNLVLMEIFICHPAVVKSMCLWFILLLNLIGELLPSHLGLLWVAKNLKIIFILNAPRRMDLNSIPLCSSLMGQLVLEHGNSFACLMMKQVLIQSTTYMGFLLQTLFSALWRLFYNFLTVFCV